MLFPPTLCPPWLVSNRILKMCRIFSGYPLVLSFHEHVQFLSQHGPLMLSCLCENWHIRPLLRPGAEYIGLFSKTGISRRDCGTPGGMRGNSKWILAAPESTGPLLVLYIFPTLSRVCLCHATIPSAVSCQAPRLILFSDNAFFFFPFGL